MKYYPKNYLHFDKPISFDTVEKYVKDPSKIAKHSFLPLIQFIDSFERYDSKNAPNSRPVKIKNRTIMYSGHLDSYIYRYYADYLNTNYYNHVCKELFIDQCVIAYRNNKQGKSNIDFAAEVINQIVLYDQAYIYVGDFTNYFDKINHSLLKENIKRVLNVNMLTNDWFNIYKSITKFGYYEKNFLEKNIDSEKNLRSQNKRSYFNNLKEFRTFQKNNKTKFNKNDFGIPQGTAISAVFANIYALNFDLQMNQLAFSHSGMYRRYSDDFILIIPISSNINNYTEIEVIIKNIAEECKINIKDEKTNTFLYSQHNLINLNNKSKQNMDYLGFNFDGKNVMEEVLIDDNMVFDIDNLKGFLNDTSSFGFIAKENNKIIGFAYCYTLLRPDGKTMFYLHSIGMLPNYQDKGYGSKLLSFIKEYSKEIGCSEMFLITDKGNPRACHVYEKLGGKNDYKDEIVYVYDYEKGDK
ncbi:GNAT family N-acetyltransferase [Staphylococcus pseudintermedius]|uniref:GNAT family N-acetyltransferase n=1 Tax=Staphylococcus pseudintermedius TaxID=283734 RepID=UPI003F519AAC